MGRRSIEIGNELMKHHADQAVDPHRPPCIGGAYCPTSGNKGGAL
jgi:hypothetical protein